MKKIQNYQLKPATFFKNTSDRAHGVSYVTLIVAGLNAPFDWDKKCYQTLEIHFHENLDFECSTSFRLYSKLLTVLNIGQN